MMYEIKDVALGLIDANPHRDLKTYPWIERKIEQLMHSIDDVGMWASIIGRAHGKRFQLAFGHHRVEAAERLRLKAVPLIIRQLSDREMLQFMGRENGEDYATDLLIMLNTWDGAVKFLANSRDYADARTGVRRQAKPLEIAQLLGWMSADTTQNSTQMSRAARACSDAFALINGGYISRTDLRGLSVAAAQELVGRAQNRMEQMEKLATQNRTPRRQIESAKQHIGKAVVTAAESFKQGKVAHRDLRGEVDANAYRYARDSGVRNTPLFASFGATLVAQIERILNIDSTAEKLDDIRKSLADITETSDWQVVQKVDLALEQVGDRAANWRKKLIPPGKKIVPLAAISAGR
jgi:ParB family chromosome partitioning protein